ncbi:unnamed protein product [Urochloa decumbens]|uniref:Ubiquitin-like protease family profile domain-containing protein n=1 Tax=Urochloa decumbens TaxID=240449 RepID=A0ABC9GPT3_9POAL
MAHRRKVAELEQVLIDVESSQELDDFSFEDESVSEFQRLSDGRAENTYSFVGDEGSSKHAAYNELIKDYAEIKIMKRKLALALNCQATKAQSMKKSKVVSSRFSVTNFAAVIDALNPDKRKVIEDYGFGSLLLFDKCLVPNKFVQWVASLVNYRSGDIVFDGKVISLSKESVSLVLGIPISDKPFPSDYAAGKSLVLSRFGKHSIPPVAFFADKILQNEPLSDEELFICFILVSLNTFLCSNSSVIPCCKYFGIFEDLGNMKHLDWCGYILDWLLEGIKTFNRAKSVSHTDGAILSGCLFYLAVIYLDHVDFGARQLPNSIPRISVWKGSMLREYAEYDMKQPGSYGYHPLLDISRTCYSKDFRYLYNPSSLNIDDHFKECLDSHAGCTLSSHLKTKICQLVQNYCFNCGLSVNLDVNTVSALPDDMKVTFCKLMQHAYSIDSRCQKLVLQLVKLLAAAPADEDLDDSDVHAFPAEQPLSNPKSGCEDDTSKSALVNGVGHIHSPPYDLSEAAHISSPINKLNPAKLKTPVVARVTSKLSKNNKGTATLLPQTPSRFAPPPSGYTPDHPLHKKLYGNSDRFLAKSCQPVIHPTEILKKERISPSSIPGLTRFRSEKLSFDKENVDAGSSQLAPILMQTLDTSPQSLPRNNFSASKANTGSTSTSQCHVDRSFVNSQHKVCPDVEFLAERTLADNVRAMTQKCDNLYNSKLPRIGCGDSISDAFLHPKYFENTTQCQPLRSRDNNKNTGGRIPFHGRLTKPSSSHNSEFVAGTSKFCVTKSDVQKYKAICNLATSQYQWSLLSQCFTNKHPEGMVKTFVVAAFYYSLFQKPNGHPDVSKRHYFFPNIAENLLKDIDDADEDILARAFKRSSRARPLYQSKMLFFPACFQDHWFVFVVDINDRKYVILDSLYTENDEFQEIVSQRMRTSFQYHWSKYVNLDMGFPHYSFIYPPVPKQPFDKYTDSGIYTMMFIEHWISPRTHLTSAFTPEDIPNIRIKIANNLVFQPKNSGMKQRVLDYQDEDQ